MRKNWIGILIACGMGVHWTTTAAAFTLDVNIEGVYTDSSFTTLAPDFAVDADGNLATVSLVAGQGVLLTIDIENAAGDILAHLFWTIKIDGAKLTLLNALAVPEILLAGPIFAPSGLLSPKPQLEVKINSPNPNASPGEVWVQAIAFRGTGTHGTGPDIAAVQLFFEVSGASGSEPLDFQLTQTAGDPAQSSSVTVNLDGATINSDLDNDLVPDATDNCRLTPNTDQRDEDMDGIGTACDCDFLQDGFVLGDDIVSLFQSFNSTSALHDIDGDGFPLGSDVVICFGRFNTVAGDP